MSIIVSSPYQLTLDTNISLAGATQTRIVYRKPDKTEGYWTATVSGTALVVSVTGAQNNLYGQWRFHSSVLFAGYDTPLLGDVVYLNVKSKYY